MWSAVIVDLVITFISIVLVIYSVHITGSYQSKFKALYFLPPIVGAINYGRKGGLIVSAICSAALFIDTWGSYKYVDTFNLLLDSDLAYIFILMLIAWLIGSMEDVEHKIRQNLLSWNQYLQNAERLSIIGQMAAGTAHEIRNPLTTIKGFLQLLQLKINNDKQEGYGEYLDIILTEIDRMNSIVSDFLVLAKPTETRLECLEVNILLQEILSLVTSESLLRGIDFKIVYGKNLPPVAGDKEKLKQVILNLINNAFQAMQEGGKLTIGTYYDEETEHVTIWIEDTGKGIPEEIMDKLFEPFFTTKETGTGLGLAISNQIIKNHKGRIRVESELGKGTKFFIDLPRLKDCNLDE
ncbi:MAG TPA: hypothetical protein GXX38_03570 [Clostridia bacterium]|nr:hypothetical protein [Clostridia bacterium]